MYRGKWYVDCASGGADYGQGMYTASVFDTELSRWIQNEMEHYQEVGNRRAYFEFENMVKKSLTKSELEAAVDFRSLGIKEQALDAFVKLAHYGDDLSLLSASEREAFETLYGDKMSILNKAAKAIKKEKMKGYQDPVSFVETLTLDKSAKIISYEDALSLRSRANKSDTDIGEFAAMLGYDAISVPKGTGGEAYTVILNRTKVIFRGG